MIFPDAYILRLLFDVINHVIIGGSAALLRGAFPGRAPPLAGLLCAPYRRPRAFSFLAGGLAWGFEPVRGSASNYRGGVSRASLAAGASSGGAVLAADASTAAVPGSSPVGHQWIAGHVSQGKRGRGREERRD